MPSRTLRLIALVALLAVAFFLTPVASASTYKVLHKFTGPDGATPMGGLYIDAAGNLYGTTYQGGDMACGYLLFNGGGCGTVFKVDTAGTFSVLHKFEVQNLGGFAGGAGYPAAGVIQDSAGNLWGTLVVGSNNECDYSFNACGIWFKLDTSGTETDYAFTPTNGLSMAGLIMDSGGNLYGTAMNDCGEGMPAAWGTIFKADSSGNQTTLYTFNPADFTGASSNPADAGCPMGNLIRDAAGNLYGTTAGNVYGAFGIYIASEVFELSPNSDSTWTLKVLHTFSGADGNNPYSGLTFDAVGNLYGTTLNGGGSKNCTGGCGTVFKLAPNSDGTWSETVIHAFADREAAHPYGGVVFDSAGNLYGATVNGGPADAGVVFKLSPQADGSWKSSGLHTFAGKPAQNPYGTLVIDKAGNLYGTTQNCGTGTGCFGTIFEITP